MKALLLILTLFMSISCFSQDYTEKYNSLMKRYEYYTSSGTLVGYKSYDNLTEEWKYYDLRQHSQNQTTYQYIKPVNLELANKALTTKQTRYDTNVQRVQETINALSTNLNESNYSTDIIKKVNTYFQEKCVKILNSTTYDYSNNSKTSEIINWLNSSMNNFVKYYVEQEKIETQKMNELRSQIINELVYNSGGYSTKDVTKDITRIRKNMRL